MIRPHDALTIRGQFLERPTAPINVGVSHHDTALRVDSIDHERSRWCIDDAIPCHVHIAVEFGELAFPIRVGEIATFGRRLNALVTSNGRIVSSAGQIADRTVFVRIGDSSVRRVSSEVVRLHHVASSGHPLREDRAARTRSNRRSAGLALASEDAVGHSSTAFRTLRKDTTVQDEIALVPSRGPRNLSGPRHHWNRSGETASIKTRASIQRNRAASAWSRFHRIHTVKQAKDC